MDNIQQQLFEGSRLRLSAIDLEKDPDVESKWTHDPDYLRALSPDTARPLSPFMVKKKYEGIEKEMKEKRNSFYFTIRLKEDDRLIGFTKIEWIEWNNGAGRLAIGVGDPEDRRKGYGSESLQMILRYAFAELNLFRLGTFAIPAYNTGAIRFLERAGFVEEVRRRESVNRDGKRWDTVSLGLLRDEWKR
ncbi:MAG: GNAT family N-acetyltransferase [Chloroflexi bacterium]|nr:GNAT family N-acetyltransferase [Chloroflexota bacterium]MBI5348025.1 GNAT family N-acetyltransferase [Chloroflexota bacterium]MBI5711829.1 GNAT family N-acetyltransferase [Chloroflexota bacterium]